ncbi:MAG: nuclear transport factor 2 family protein [Gemmatimonadota bacterium]|nr:nuclear transport factor 2 family protein [Gemmatimonadota bacterium]MDH4350151.1 nuclear transport factor 2 family protein [Gemmatimonadota bacterium]MDH5197856.1 nuclear transport factor 2 family protein [Gemmatimonadota bacterium]
MRIAPFTVAAALIVGLSCAPTGPSTADIAADSSAVAAVIGKLQAANNAGDVEAWVALFDDGAVYMPPGSPAVATRESLRQIAIAGFGQAQANVTLTPVEITIAGDWAFARVAVGGDVTLTADGRNLRIDMKEIAIFHRQSDGGWRVARLINNRNTE